MQAGNLGDRKGLGDGISELRLTFGPGYRIYYAEARDPDTGRIVLLLLGGTKRRQSKDVAAAKLIAARFKTKGD